MNRILSLLIAFFFLHIGMANAQDPGLANQYFTDGEFEKSASVYEQLLEKDPNSDYYFSRYIASLTELKEFDRCEKAIKKQLKKQPENNTLYVTYGQMYEEQGKDDDAKQMYRKAIEKMAADFASVSRLASVFSNAGKFDFAIETYQKGAQDLKDPNRFAFNLGEMYRRKGDPAKMIEYYIESVIADPQRLSVVQTMLARFISPGEYEELQGQLYAKIQTVETPELIELLAWSFVQRKDYKSALRQFKALDKRLGEGGQRIFKLAEDAADNRDFDTAIAGYEYIIAEKGSTNPFFFDAKRDLMECRRRKITEGYQYTQQDLVTLETEYESFLSQFGKTRQTAQIIMQLADLEAYYINNLPKAINILEELKQLPGLERETLANAKLKLADVYLISGDVWESTLLYSQVDKDFKEEQIGQEARFKNARLAYFNGDFLWSQAQFDILRSSTSKLISNDAIDLSVFIMDNLNLDTTSEAITLYSGAELLVYQNRFEDAFKKLDTLKRNFPDHSLQDDILYLEAQIHEKKREWEDAAVKYAEIAERFPQDIRADNSLYALAQLYETKLNDTEKAKALYERIFMEYSGSVYAVDARKRFRILRGDKMQ